MKLFKRNSLKTITSFGGKSGHYSLSRFKRKHPLKAIIGIVAGSGIGLTAFTLGGDNSYDFFNLQHFNQTIEERLALEISLNWEEYKKEQSTANNDKETTSTNTIPNTATDGSGLNLLLINNIQTEGYVKDLLTTFAKNQQGQYSSKYAIHAPVQMLLAAANMEHGCFNNTKIPKFYFAWDNKTNAPYYNVTVGGLTAEEMTFEGFGIFQQSRLKGSQYYNEIDGRESAFGMFGFKNKTLSDMANVNPVGSAGRTEGYAAYLPDACVAEDSMLYKAFNSMKISNTDELPNVADGALAGLTGLSNNRGNNGAITMLYGIAHNNDTRGNIAWKLSPENDSLETKTIIINTPYNDMLAGYNSLRSKNSLDSDFSHDKYSSGGNAWYLGTMLLLESGWYCTQDYVSGACGTYFQYASKAWNALHQSDQVTTSEALMNKLVKYQRASVSNAIYQKTGKLVSTDDTQHVYGITEDDYNNNTYREANGSELSAGYTGYVYTVLQSTSKAYKNKYSDGTDPYILIDLETTGCGYYYSCAFSGAAIYAWLLKYAGVDVDPTDPSTYMNAYYEDGEWVPTDDLDATLITHGLDASKMTIERAKVLRAAANLLDITYHMCRGDHCDSGDFKCDGHCYNSPGRPTHLDCSSFVWRAYHDAGFSNSMPVRTADYTSAVDEGTLEYIGTIGDCVAEGTVKPGDVLVRRSGSGGHATIYMGSDFANVYTIEAREHGKPSAFANRKLQSMISDGFKVYRYKGID